MQVYRRSRLWTFTQMSWRMHTFSFKHVNSNWIKMTACTRLVWVAKKTLYHWYHLNANCTNTQIFVNFLMHRVDLCFVTVLLFGCYLNVLLICCWPLTNKITINFHYQSILMIAKIFSNRGDNLLPITSSHSKI